MSEVERRVFVGLGSNLQGPEQQIRNAVDALAELPETALIGVSSLYRSRPLGPPDQPDFTNAAAQLGTGLSPEAMLDALQQIEVRQGRVRSARWGPRTIDLDLLLYGTEAITTPRLKVPHPGLSERAFVLIPLLELDPGLTIPGHGPATDLLARISTEDVMRITRPFTLC